MKQRFLVIFSLFLIFIFLLPAPSFANHRLKVLGISTKPSDVELPPTVEGPGFILPDSPLFFLDQLKQSVRLFFTFTPESKAKIYSDIASERLAELRMMLARDNTAGVRVDLQGISDNLKLSAQELNNAKLTGRNVSDLAKVLNDNIKVKQYSLDVLEKESNGEMKGLVTTAQSSLIASKIEVEDSLSEADFNNEIRDDLSRITLKKLEEVSGAASELGEDLAQLQIEASVAASQSLQRREEALKKAIAEKNESQKIVEERLIEQEKKKQEKLLKLQGETAREAKKAIEEAQKAAEKFKISIEILNQTRNQTLSQTPTNGSAVLNASSNSSENRSIISP